MRGLAEAQQHHGLQRFVSSSNYSLETLGDSRPLVANVARFPGLTFSHVLLPDVEIDWPRDRGSVHRALLLVAAAGKFRVRTEGAVIRRGAGVALVLPGDEPVRIAMADHQNDLVYIGFGSEMLTDLALPPGGRHEGSTLDWSLLAPFYAFARTMCAAGIQTPAAAASMAGSARALVKELIGMVVRDSGAEHDAFETARAVIRSEFADPRLSVSMIAQRVNVAPRTLQALFAAEGSTVSGELRAARVRAAKAMKRSNPRLTARQIADAAGFGSVSAMSRALRGDSAPT